MVENFIVIQIIFAEKFVSQDFNMKAASVLSGPTKTCVTEITHFPRCNITVKI